MIDHIRFYENTIADWIVGTTRTRYVHSVGAGTEQQIYIFLIRTVSATDKTIMPSSGDVKVKRLDHDNAGSANKLSAGSYVTGIMVNNGFHMVLFSPVD